MAILTSSYPYGNGQQSDVVTLIHDAFQPLSYWNNFMPRENFAGVAIDTHIYQMFVDEVGFQSIPQHTQSKAFFRSPCLHRLCPSMKQGISSLHAETQDVCLNSMKISYGRLSANGRQQ